MSMVYGKAMPSTSTMTAKTALSYCLEHHESVRAIDVRSPAEYEQGFIQPFSNLPILTNEERHQVGLAYKEKGQLFAIQLGHELVSPSREERINAWLSHLKGANVPSLVTCWRGGLRSRIASDWLRAAGVDVLRVEGGYKALRHELLQVFERLPPLLVLSGATGSGKTQLLTSLAVPKLDLEKIARHRGSAFGGWPHAPQPSQAAFENELALPLWHHMHHINEKYFINKQYLVEDESAMIGKVRLPEALKQRMRSSPVVRVVEPLPVRAERIYKEYILGAPDPAPVLRQALVNIERRLGGLLTAEVLRLMNEAFVLNDQERHLLWIKLLLQHYYDKAYAFSFSRCPRQIVFEGDWQACQNWIQTHYA